MHRAPGGLKIINTTPTPGVREDWKQRIGRATLVSVAANDSSQALSLSLLRSESQGSRQGEDYVDTVGLDLKM